MEDNILFQIRLTGLLIEDNQILIVKQRVSTTRSWSLPGGRLENGETIEEGIKREMWEETGLNTRILKLLYLCDKPDATPPLIHITFLLERVGGQIKLPTNEFDRNPISDVKMIYIDDLPNYGFSEKFKDIVKNGFPNSGDYRGLKVSIGL